MTIQATPSPALAGDAASGVADVFRAGRFEADDWRRLADDEALPSDGRVFLSVSRFLKEAEADTLGNRPVGVLVEPADRVSAIAPHLDRLSAVAIDFPKFADGRGFSHAALLVRHGFKGEIRAVGNVLIDQITHLRRVGFTAFEVRHALTRRYLAEGRDPAPRHYYQPGQGDEAPAGTRPWLRKAV